MTKAIKEIQLLQTLVRNQKKTGPPTGIDMSSFSSGMQVLISNNQVTKSLVDPFNRYPHSRDDLNTTFNVLLTNELNRIYQINRDSRTVESFMGVLQTLFDIAEQLNNLQYKLFASIMEEVLHCVIIVNPAELKRVLERNFSLYKQVKV